MGGGYGIDGNGYEGNKDDLQKRLRRVEGQVRGIARMVDEDKYCIDILTQVSAATKALETVALSLLGDHLSHCVAEAKKRKKKKKKKRGKEKKKKKRKKKKEVRKGERER